MFFGVRLKGGVFACPDRAPLFCLGGFLLVFGGAWWKTLVEVPFPQVPVAVCAQILRKILAFGSL